MPELPEVETVRRSLLPLVGRRIEVVEVREPRLRLRIAADFAVRLRGRSIEAIERRGKYLLFRLDGGLTLLAHLGMSGALLVQPTRTGAVHDHVCLQLDDARFLVLNDPRRFGILKLGRGEDFRELRNVGPDPLSEQVTAERLYAATRRRKKPIKNLLMDQGLLAGIGNIYANEMLYVAGVRPTRPAGRLSRAEVQRLYEAMRAVLQDAIQLGGSSISDYRDGDGRTGYFQLTLKVYDRAGQPCDRCGTTVRRIVQAGRSSFYCRVCQR